MISELTRCTRRKALFVTVPALLLGLLDVLARLGTAPTSRGAVVVLVVAAVLWILLSLADARARPVPQGASAPESSAPPADGTAPPAPWQETAALTGIAMAGWLLLWAVMGPMASMNDTYWILRDPFATARQHPIVYGMVTSGLVQGIRWVTGSLVAGVVVAAAAQVALYGVAIAWTMTVLARMRVSRTARVLLALTLGALPITADYTVALVKDAAFTAFVVMLVPLLLTILRTRGRFLQERRGLAITAAVVLGFALTRNNALMIVVLVAALVVLVSAGRRRSALVRMGVIVVLAFVPQTIVSFASGPQKAAESLGIPLQMVGSTLVHDPSCIAPQDARVFARILPAETWRAVYRPDSVDPVKDSTSFSREAMRQERSAFLLAAAHTLVRCPGPMLAGYREQTRQLWTWDAVPLGRTGQSYFLEPISNRPADREEIRADLAREGVVATPLLPGTPGSQLVPGYRALLAHTPGTGTWVWALVLVAAALWYRRRTEVIVLVTPSLLLWATLLAGAPTAMPFRYVAYLPWILAISLAVLLGVRGARPQARASDP